MIPIVILAAGRSARMRGTDKLLEKIGAEALLRRQVRRALATGQPVYVALGPDQPARAAVLADLDATVLVIPDAEEGLSATMRGAVAALPVVPAFMLLLADLVEIETSDILAVLAASAAHPDHLIWRGATQDGKPGHPVLFDASLRDGFAKLSGDSGGEALVQPLRQQTWLVPLANDRARRDLDTPEDWAEWRKLRS